MVDMFSDSEDNTYNLNQIVKIGRSQPRGERNGALVYEHQVWVQGLDEPIWVDFRIVDAITELEGSVISALPDFYVIDFKGDLTKPRLEPIIGWRVSRRHAERVIPVTINGNNNGELGTSLPILKPDGSVDDWDREFACLDDCIRAYSEARVND